MKIEFESKRTKRSDAFCDYLIKLIQRKILSAQFCGRLKLRIDSIRLAGIFDLIGISDLQDSLEFSKSVSKSITWVYRKGYYRIQLNTNATWKLSGVSIDYLVRLIDFGNQLVRPSMLFTSVFYQVQKLLFKLYISFLYEKKTRRKT